MSLEIDKRKNLNNFYFYLQIYPMFDLIKVIT